MFNSPLSGLSESLLKPFGHSGPIVSVLSLSSLQAVRDQQRLLTENKIDAMPTHAKLLRCHSQSCTCLAAHDVSTHVIFAISVPFP